MLSAPVQWNTSTQYCRNDWENPKYWDRKPSLRGEIPNTNRLGRHTAHLKADIWSSDGSQNVAHDFGVTTSWLWKFRNNPQAPSLRQVLHEATNILILFHDTFLCTIKLILLILRNPNFLNYCTRRDLWIPPASRACLPSQKFPCFGWRKNTT
jgi:hypothetical protein